MTEESGIFNQDRFRVFFQQNKDAMFVADPLTRKLIDCNLAAQKLTGRSREEILKMQADDLHPPEYRDATMDIFKRQVAGEEITGESVVLSRNGQRIPVSINGAAIEIDGRPLALGTFRDVTELKKNEEILRNSKTQFQELFNNISSGVAIYKAKDGGEDFIFVDINKSGERLSKVRRQEVIGKSVLDVFPGVMAIGLFEIFKQVLQTGQPQHHPVSLYQDGRLTEWVKNYVFKLPLGEIVAVYEDLTEFKQAQESLKEAKDYLDNIINTIADPVFVKDSQHRFVLINDALCGLIGRPRQEIIGKTDRDFFPKEQVDVFLAKDEKLLENGQESINEEEITDVAGITRSIVTKKKLYIDRFGNKFIVGIIRDITVSKNTEKALFESEERFRSVALNAGEWIWETDAQGRYIYCSPAVENILGFKPEDLLGKYFYDLFPLNVKGKFKQSAFEIFSRKESFNNFLNRNIHKDGHEVILQTSGIPVVDNRGKLLGYRGVDRDITDLKKAEKAFKESQEQLQLALRSANMGIWHLDLVNKTRDFDNQTCIFLGIDPATFKGGDDEFYRVVHPEDRDHIAVSLDKAIASGQLYEPEYRVIWPDGSIHHITSRATVEYDVSGNPKQVNGLIWDITERKQLEEKTRKQLYELEVFYKASLNREERIIELKKEVESLKQKLQG